MEQHRSLVFLTPSLDWGGAEVMLTGLAKDCAARGYRVLMVSMKRPRAFVAELQNTGVNVISLDMSSALSVPRGVGRLVGAIRQFQPELIHAHMFHASVLARVLRLFGDFKLICTVHSTVEARRDRTAAPIRDLIFRLTDRWSDCTTVVGTRVQSRYERKRLVAPDRLRMISAGVDSRVFRPDVRERERLRRGFGWTEQFVWIAVGRLELAKDYPSLLRAFRQMSQAQRGSVLAIVGSGTLRGTLEADAAALGLTESVLFLGTRNDVPELLNAADGFVLSSAWEGGPIALLEAAATALPVVSTDVGEASRMVRQGHTGFIVPPADAGTLAEAMIRVETLSREDREEMGRQGRLHVTANFSIAATHEAHISLYEEVLGRAV